MRATALLRFAAIGIAASLVTGAADARGWDGNAWADYRAFLGPIDAAAKANLQAIVAVGEANGRVEGRHGQIGDSITESSAYFRNAILNGVTGNETGHDYGPIRSWLAYSGTQPADANSFYRDHGKGPDYGNLGGWHLADAVAAGHPAHGVLTGDGTTPGGFSWVLVMYGTNDIDDGAWDAAAWKEQLRGFVQGYAALGVLPAVSTIPPEAAHSGDGRVEAANEAVRALAAEERIPWVDFHALVLHFQPANWHGTLIGADGTHPSAATGGQGFSEEAQTTTDGYALRTKLTFDLAEKLRDIVWNDGSPDSGTNAPEIPASSPDTGLRAAPNPFRSGTMFLGAPPGTLSIVDVSGRQVAVIGGTDPERMWNGNDALGRPVPAGVYFVRGGLPRTTLGSVVRLR
ncbi:SGNH/GDSL hydrolase family protein [bacterium]|nr:SGNH/GDSL hydrolase family protein [bacterium]